MRREIAIALRARITWLVAALCALLVGHGFVLALDLYSAASRSALASVLQSKEMDPLAGIVRPTLGGLGLAIVLFVPMVASRALSIEKERRTFGALCLLEGSTDRVVANKLFAAIFGAATLLVAPIAVLIAYAAAGGHLDAIETAWALAGEALHLVLVVAVSVAAAAWTRTFAQAATIGVLISLTSWAIDAAEGFAALAWLGGASACSIEERLAPFQRGIASVGSVAWLLVATVLAVVLALVGARFDFSRGRRAAVTAASLVVSIILLFVAATSRRAYDWTEQRRASLPPDAVAQLRRLSQPISIDAYLDRDDSRRRQLESDVLAKLFLARPDLVVRTPLDDAGVVSEGRHDAEYGRIVIHVGASTRETRSTSRREIVTLILEAGGASAPDWSQPVYSGYPFVVSGARRTVLAIFAYVVVPFALVALGALLTRRRSVR